MRILLAVFIVLCIGCGEHPSKVKRQEFRQHIKDFKPVEDAPIFIPEPPVEHDDAALRKSESELQATRDRLAKAEEQLAAATKGGFTGAVVWMRDDCIPCHKLVADLKATKVWITGYSNKCHFWVRESSEAGQMPGTPKLRAVPTTDYYVDGKYIGRIEGYDGTKAALNVILAKNPKSEKKAAMAANDGGQALASVPPVFPPPAPPSEEIVIESTTAMQVGCGAPAVFSASDCGGFQSSCAAPMSYGCAAPVQYAAPVFQYPAYTGGVGVQVGRCFGGVCW